MLEFLQPNGPVAAFRASASLTGDDYDRMTAEFERLLKEHDRIAVFAELTELKGLTPAALVKDLRYSVSKLSELRRFARIAVVTDVPWMRAWAQFAWSLVPHATLRTFPSSERDAALAWASELRADQPREEEHGLRWLPTTRPDTYALAWAGKITDDDIDAIVKRLQAELETHVSVRVLLRIERMGGIQPHALFRTALVRLKALGLRKVERYAVVGGPNWVARYASIAQRLTGIELRHFTSDNEAEAWAWLEAQPATQERTAAAGSDVAAQN